MNKLVLSLAFVPAALGAQQMAATAAQRPALDSTYRPISLAEAVQLAQENSPTAIAARGSIRNAEGALKQTKAGWIPTLNFSMGQSKGGGQQRNPVTGRIEEYQERPWSYSTGVSTNLVLWDGGQRIANAAANRAQIEAAEVSEVATRYNISRDVKTQYFNILASREQESAARTQLQQAEQQLAASSARLRAGAVIISDSIRAQIAVRTAQLNLLTAQNNIRNQSATLTRLVGSPNLVTANPADTAALTFAKIDSVEILRLAMEGPAVKQAEAALEQSRAQIKAAKGPLWPSVSANASYSGNGRDQLYGLKTPFQYGYTYGLNLGFPIFDRYGRSEAIARAEVTATNNEANLREARLAAQQNILQQIGNLRTAEEQIRIQELQVRAAEEDLRVQTQRYTLGSATILEVTTSQTALNQARFQLINARQQYRIALAQLEATIGRDLR
jgi:outer membrane protein